MVTRTPLLVYVWNRYGKATSKKEAVVELRITYERRQKYISTGIWLLPKHWHNGSVINRIDAMQLNQMLDKLLVEVRKVIMEMVDEDQYLVKYTFNRLKINELH